MRRLLCLLVILLALPNFPVYSEETEEGYFALYFDNSRCGYGVQSREVQGEKVISTDNMHIELKRMGTAIKLEMKEISIESLSGEPLGFRAEQQMSLVKTIIKGEINPNGIMDVEIENAGNKQKLKREYPKGALMTEGLMKLIKSRGMAPGTSYEADIFSPSSMQALKMSFNVGETKKVDLLGRVVELVEITGDYILTGSSKVSYTYYMDMDYNIQKMIIPMSGINIVMVACPESFAKSNLEATEMISGMLIKSPAVIAEPEKAKEIVYTIKPKEAGADLYFPVMDSQDVEETGDDGYRVTVRPLAGDSSALFPYTGDDPEILSYLESTAYTQSDHPEIKALARSCVEGKKYAYDAALAIESFVGSYIEKKDLSVGYASALEVVRSRQGDCTEHALLTAALCRAAGIPARVVTGVVYVNSFLNMNDCFGGHAWAEAYIGGKWIGLDAAFRGTRNRGFDAAHIALATGSGEPGDFFDMMGTLGMFEIENIEIKR